jgi:hypothetical protein
MMKIWHYQKESVSQRVLNDLYRTRLSCGRIRPPTPASKLPLFLGFSVRRCFSLLTGEVGGWGSRGAELYNREEA